MYYLGIDIGKNICAASLLSEDKAIFKGMTFSNSTEGAEKLLQKLSLHVADLKEVKIGMEATGHYWLALYSFLREKKYDNIHVLNPIQTDGWRKGIEIRKRKTDNIDSALIAQMMRYGDFTDTVLSDDDIFALRNFTRFREYLINSTSDLKRKVICVLDQIFPEYQEIFSDVFGVTSSELLLQYSTPAELENLSVDELEALLLKLSRKRIKRDKAVILKDLAANSFGVTFSIESFSFQLKALLEQIKFIEKQAKNTEKEIDKIMKKLSSPITTIPGIGKVTGAVILAEIGDIQRFDKPAQLVAFAGIDATVSQSGNSCSNNNKMSKRGSTYLRKALFQSALVAAAGKNPDPILSVFYQKKINEGKHHYVCIGAVARKLCHIIFAVLCENRSFERRLS